MRVLLINPWIHDFAAYDFWLKPIGLLYVGAALKQIGIDVYLIDLLNRHDPDLSKFISQKPDKKFGTGKFHSEQIDKPLLLKNIPRKYKRYGAPVEYFLCKLGEIGRVDAIFVTSSLTYWWPGVAETIKYIKQIFPKTPVVLGGLYARLYTDHAKKNTNADFIFDKDLSNLPHLINQLFGKTIGVSMKKWFEELDPAYELYKKVGYLVFLTSLGCPYSCTYCISSKLWKKFVQRDPQKVVAAIKRYVDLFQVKNIVFFDDAILINKERHFMKLLKLLIKEQLKVNYHLPNGLHARLLDEETAKLMKEAGFKTIKLGYETSGNLQKETGGKVYDEELVRAAEILLKAGFTKEDVQAYIMVNMPDQKEDDVLKAIEICKQVGISVSINEYTPIYGSLDWFKLVDQGAIDEKIDPVMLNNTVLPYWFKNNMDFQAVQRLKALAHSN